MGAKTINIYLANPLGFSVHFEKSSLESLVKLLEGIKVEGASVKVLEPFAENAKCNPPPMIDKKHSYEEHESSWQEFNDKVYRTNNYDLMQNSQLMVAILNGADVDSGVACEIGKFCKKGPIIGYRDDFRLGENIASRGINLEITGSIKESDGCIVGNLADLEKTVKEYVLKLTS